MNLHEIEKLCINELPNINIDLIYNYNFQPNVIQYAQSTPYYKCLAAYAKLFNVNNCLELGTASGISSLIISLYAKNVYTFDLTHQHVADMSVFDKNNIHATLLDKPEDCLNVINDKYDMIFVDTYHNGDMEKLIHQKILNSNFKGIAFYDDIKFNQGMIDFWNSINIPKLATFWHFTYFGLVQY